MIRHGYTLDCVLESPKDSYQTRGGVGYWALASCLLSALPATARASQNFPDAVQDDSDVDRDGVSDFDELQTGTDPDVADVMDEDGGFVSAPPDDTPIPRTGCSIVAAGGHAWLTATRPSPTVGPNSGSAAPSRRISGDAWLVCGLALFAVFGRLRAQRKRMASATR